MANADSVLFIWTIYDHPLDFPTGFVARMYTADGPTSKFLTAGTLDEARKAVQAQSLLRLQHIPRDISDDEKIVESWV